MIRLIINSDALVVYANNLERLHRSALPVVVRQTLNKAAFDTKKIHLDKVTDQLFPKRQKNFFRAFSSAQPARGFDISKMVSKVGIMPRGNQAAENLTQMERGGVIHDRDFLPTPEARISKDKGKLVRKRKKLGVVGKKRRAVRVSAGNKKDFVVEAIKAGEGGTVIYGNTMFEIQGIGVRGSGSFIRATAIYTFEQGRSISVAGTGFMKKSSNLGALAMPNNFNKLAKQRINKVLRRK